MDLNSLLSQFGGGPKDTVYMSVTPGVGLELIQLDLATHTVKNYAYRDLEYNESLRQIPNMEAFKTAVSELFEELGVSKKSNVYLNLPMVFFGKKDLPLLLGDDAVSEALMSEVEQSYIFKRFEPAISWSDAGTQQSGEMRSLFYSAIQKNTIEDIKNILAELGGTLCSVEMSLTSLLKALSFSGLAQEQMKDGISWNLMIVNQSGYSICSMLGKTIIDYYEEPLAIRSFEGEEIYNVINASAQITLMSYPANYLYIVSETDIVSAELLSKRLQVGGVVTFWENNNFKKQDAVPVSLEIIEETAHKISLEAIGIASNVTMPAKFNFMGNDAKEAVAEDPNEPVHVAFGSTEFDISPNSARNISLAIAGVIIVPALLLFLIVPKIATHKQAKLDDVASKLSDVEAEIKRFEGETKLEGTFDVVREIKKVAGDNRSKLMAYSALGEAVPKNLWLTYFVAKEDGKFDIKGNSSSVEDVYLFFRNMKDSLINTQLRLHKLEMKSDSVDEAVTVDLNQSTDYEFEITNMTAADLSGALNLLSDTAEKALKNKGNKNQKNLNSGKSLFNVEK